MELKKRSFIITSNPLKKNTEGQALLVLVLLSSALFVGFLGLWIAMANHKWYIEDRLRIDKCVADWALDLTSKRRLLSKSRAAMNVLRASAIAAVVRPEVEEGIQKALLGLYWGEKAIIASWSLTRGKAIIKQSCNDAKKDLPAYLPDIGCTWDEEQDWLGPLSCSFDKIKKEPDTIELYHRGHKSLYGSAATIKVSDESRFLMDQWETHWTEPKLEFHL